MQTQSVKLNQLQAGITSIESQLASMKRVLPFVKSFSAKRDIGAGIRKHQSEIREIRRQIFEIKF